MCTSEPMLPVTYQPPHRCVEVFAVVAREAGRVRMRVVGHGERAHQEEARHAERVPGQMARQALIVSSELRPIGRLLLDRVEDGALTADPARRLRADRRPAPNRRRRSSLKIQRARVLQTDEVGLKAVSGERRDLRLGRNIERVEHRAEVAAAAVEGQTRLAVENPSIEAGDTIADGAGASTRWPARRERRRRSPRTERRPRPRPRRRAR